MGWVEEGEFLVLPKGVSLRFVSPPEMVTFSA